MKKNRTYKVNAFLMMMLAGTLSFSAAASESESGLLPAAAAQQQPVKGTIVDVNGNPIPGASVMIPGTTTGAVTAVDGTFSLNVAEGAKVEVGCLGYATITVTAKNGMKIVLKEDAEALRHWEANTNVRFYNATGQPTRDETYNIDYPYIYFCNGTGNNSYVGRIGGKQVCI